MGVRSRWWAAGLLALAGAPALAQEAAPAACQLSRFAGDAYDPAPAFAGQTDAPAAAPTKIAVTEVAQGLSHPWSLAFLPDGRLLVTERAGTMRIVGKDGEPGAPIAGVPEIVQASLSGLTDVLLDPDFAANRTLYFNYITLAPGQAKPGRDAPSVGRVVRARLSADGTALEDLKVLYEGDGAVRRLVLARDGTLFVTSGTGIVSGPEPRSHASGMGKVLRIGRDGSIPRDNPWAREEGALPALYDVGHRDPEGAALDAEGQLWTVEHGPRGGDELNLIEAGGDYGHGFVSYGREYDERPINGGATEAEGVKQPVYFWTPSIGPSGLAFYDGGLFPGWKGDALVGSMPMKHLVRLHFEGGKVVAEEKLLADLCVRIRDVRVGPEGAVYLLTDEDDGKVLKLTPAA